MQVTVIGAGVAGLTCAVELAERGATVEVLERGESLGASSCSWYAGGMLAPWCERESADPLVAQLGEQSIDWWSERFPQTVRNGSLVIAQGRDVVELASFARRTERYVRLGREQIGELESDLAERFPQALFFPSEAHIDPRAALRALESRLAEHGVRIRFGVDASRAHLADGKIVDCSGLAAREVLRDLRGVRGEMLVVRSCELSLSRPVRVLHPRVPVYVVPRGDGIFMIGATMIESDAPRRITARSMLELLSAACALHPAFAEAEILEIGTGVRPAFPDNLPHIRWRDDVLYVNGFYRHGFLLAPALARMAADVVLNACWFPEVMDEDHRQRRLA